MPPAPWHMGMPPSTLEARLITPVENATERSDTGRSGNSRLFSSVIEINALPKVSGTCGKASSTNPVQRSGQVRDDQANDGILNPGCRAPRPARRYEIGRAS